MSDCGVGVGHGPAGALGRRDRHLQRGPAGRRGVVPAPAEGGEPPTRRCCCSSRPQAIAEALAARSGCKGPVLSVNTACAAGANAIGYAAELIRQGHADAVLAGGADALSRHPVSRASTRSSRCRPKPAAPYSRDRKGLSLGEGGGMLVLMREDLARGAGRADPGRGRSATACPPTATTPPRRIPTGRAPARAIQTALGAAGRRARARSATSTATAPARRRTTRPRPPRPRYGAGRARGPRPR